MASTTWALLFCPPGQGRGWSQHGPDALQLGAPDLVTQEVRARDSQADGSVTQPGSGLSGDKSRDLGDFQSQPRVTWAHLLVFPNRSFLGKNNLL